MIPWRANQMAAAFVAALAGVTVATQACLARGVPFGTAVLLLAFSGALIFSGALLAMALVGFARNPIRRAVRLGHRGVREACAACLRRHGRWKDPGSSAGEDPLFLDDPPPQWVAGLGRALAEAGLYATPAEVLEYVIWCRWLTPKRPGSLRRTAPGCVRWAGNGPAGSAERTTCPETAAC